MFYINLGKETNKIQISHEEILVKYPTDQDDIIIVMRIGLLSLMVFL